jgi:hypothetical protein
MAADFNLSAEISVQLAQTAAANLQRQIDSANIALNINTAQVKKAVKAAVVAAKAQLGEDIAAIVTIDADKQSKQDFLDLFKKKTVPVSLKFDVTALAAELDASIKQILKEAGFRISKEVKDLEKKKKDLNAATNVGGSSNPATKPGNLSKQTKIDNSAKYAEKLAKDEKKAVQQLSKAYRQLLKDANSSFVNIREAISCAVLL